MKKEVTKNNILTLLLLVSILSGYSLLSSDHAMSKENGHLGKVKNLNTPERRIKKEIGTRKLKKMMMAAVISVSVAGLVLVYLFFKK